MRWKHIGWISKALIWRFFCEADHGKFEYFKHNIYEEVLEFFFNEFDCIEQELIIASPEAVSEMDVIAMEINLISERDQSNLIDNTAAKYQHFRNAFDEENQSISVLAQSRSTPISACVQGIGESQSESAPISACVQGIGESRSESTPISACAQGIGESKSKSAPISACVQGIGESQSGSAPISACVQGIGVQKLLSQSPSILISACVQCIGKFKPSNPISACVHAEIIGESHSQSTSISACVQGIGASQSRKILNDARKQDEDHSLKEEQREIILMETNRRLSIGSNQFQTFRRLSIDSTQTKFICTNRRLPSSSNRTLSSSSSVSSGRHRRTFTRRFVDFANGQHITKPECWGLVKIIILNPKPQPSELSSRFNSNPTPIIGQYRILSTISRIETYKICGSNRTKEAFYDRFQRRKLCNHIVSETLYFFSWTISEIILIWLLYRLIMWKTCSIGYLTTCFWEQFQKIKVADYASKRMHQIELSDRYFWHHKHKLVEASHLPNYHR